MFATRRRLLASAGAAALLAACEQKAAFNSEDPSDMAIGDPNAPVRIIEYASVTCPHCREWHDTVWPQLKANYIDTGKVRFVFREFPTPPIEVAMAGFQVARCGARPPEQYFAMLDVLFAQQGPIYEAAEKSQAKEKLLEIGKSSGLSEEAFTACVADPAGIARIKETVENGTKRFNVSGTPTFVMNGKPGGVEMVQYATLAKAIDAAISGGAKAG